MYNLINDYYIKWYNIVVILYNDCIKETEMKISLLIIFLAYLLFSIIALIIFLKLLSKFSVDREKPINLFQTIKKQIFENLKNSAENFSNKLLNKFFGNEDNDDESQQDYQSNIQPNDINIVKFKAVNEYNSSIKNAFSFLNIIIIILAYIIINLFYFLVIYLDNQGRHQKVNQFILLLDKNNLAQSNFVLSLNVFKSY
jgi:ABC-type multidrug transport system fused ATPase/permease subunit